MPSSVVEGQDSCKGKGWNFEFLQVEQILKHFKIVFRVDSYSSNPFWFSNYTDDFVRIVVQNYSDLVIGEFALAFTLICC